MKKKRTRFTYEEDRQLIQMAAASATLEEAAAMFRTSIETIERKAKLLGLRIKVRADGKRLLEGEEVMGRRSTWTSKDDFLLRALAASGENSAAIAARLKRTAAGIRKHATSLGIGLAASRKARALKAKGR
jgi:hypothetical protein